MGFPELPVRLDCGFTEFTIPERELTVLTTGKPVKTVQEHAATDLRVGFGGHSSSH
jgi:hypothetical protein